MATLRMVDRGINGPWRIGPGNPNMAGIDAIESLEDRRDHGQVIRTRPRCNGHREFGVDCNEQLWDALCMAATATSKSRKKTPMSEDHKAALARGREEGRVVRRYLEALESSKPRRGRKRTPESIKKRLASIDASLPTVDPLSRLHLIEERQRLESELSHTGETVDMAALEKSFIKVARVYGERKGISYSAWRTVGVSASVLQQAKIPRSRS